MRRRLTDDAVRDRSGHAPPRLLAAAATTWAHRARLAAAVAAAAVALALGAPATAAVQPVDGAVSRGQLASPTESMAVLQTRIRDLTDVIASTEPVQAAQGRDLGAAEVALAEADERAGDIGRRMFVGRAAVEPEGVSLPDGAMAEFGIDPEQRQSREAAIALEAQQAARARVEEARDALRRTQARLAAYRSDLAAARARLAVLQRQAAERALAAARAAARAAAEAYRAGHPTSSAPYSGGPLETPVDGPLTSPFGERFDPYYHRYQLHAGIDIGAGTGAPIRAAASGWVSRAGENGGYGNYTCLSHGRSHGARLSTCYGHQSQILVREGEHVARGQVIGLVGATGAATGPHLHFEVRLDGSPVDPMPWLSGAPIR